MRLRAMPVGPQSSLEILTLLFLAASVSCTCATVTSPSIDHRVVGGSRQKRIAQEVVANESFNVSCCPPGFVNVDLQYCLCGSSIQDKITRCDERDGQTAFVKGGTWAGYVSSATSNCPSTNASVYVGICPNGYCANGSAREIELPQSASVEELDYLICGPTRTGILCGSCREGYGPGVNLFLAPCVHCRTDPLSQYGWLIWMALEFLPLCVMLFVVLYFNIDFLSGPFTSLWLYIQAVNASFPVSTTGPIPLDNTPGSIVARLIYILFYGIFDLQFFTFLLPPFCLTPQGDRLDVLDMMIFKSATRVFPLLIILAVIAHYTFRRRYACPCKCRVDIAAFPKLSACLSKRFSFTSALHGLAAFFILVYSRFLTYCSNLFGRSLITSTDPNAVPLYVLWLQGNAHYFQDVKHIIYSFVTLGFVLVLILPPVVLLLLYPALHQVQEYALQSRFRIIRKVFHSRVFSLFNTSSMQQFADLFQSSYKRKYRFFAGFLLLIRIAIAVMWNVVGSRSSGFAFLAALSAFVLMLHSLLQPNLKKWINVLDTFMYSHMIALNILATYISATEEDPNLSSLKTFYGISLFTPILYPILYLCLKAYRKFNAVISHRCNSATQNLKATDTEGTYSKENQPINNRPIDSKPDHDHFSYSEFAEVSRNDELWLDVQ